MRHKLSALSLCLLVAGCTSTLGPKRERYAALRHMAVEEGVSLVLLAHHRRDQAETVLLQALRSAGPG